MVSPIIGVITCKQLVYPVIMDLPYAQTVKMNSRARQHRRFTFLVSSSLLFFFFCSRTFSSSPLGITVLLSRANDSFLRPYDRLSCPLFDWKFIGVPSNRYIRVYTLTLTRIFSISRFFGIKSNGIRLEEEISLTIVYFWKICKFFKRQSLVILLCSYFLKFGKETFSRKYESSFTNLYNFFFS